MSKIKKFKKPTEDDLDEMYIKANRKGSREAELENSTGFKREKKNGMACVSSR